MHKINIERDRMKQLSHIRNLLALAITDGSFDNQEKELVFEIAINSGITAAELKQIDQNPASIPYIKPDTNEERIDQLYDLVLLMMVNKEIEQNELSLCKTMAINLGIEISVVNRLIPAIIESISKGVKPQFCIPDMLSLFD